MLIPELRPGDVVIMDSSHKRASVRERIAGAGATLRFLPPYNPDFNPIEEASFVVGPASFYGPNFTNHFNMHDTDRSLAAFARGTCDFIDIGLQGVRLTAGLRYTTERPGGGIPEIWHYEHVHHAAVQLGLPAMPTRRFLPGAATSPT